MPELPAYRALLVREADGSASADEYTVDIEVDGKEHRFSLRPDGGEVQIPQGLQQHKSVDLLKLAAEKALKEHLSAHKDNPSG